MQNSYCIQRRLIPYAYVRKSILAVGGAAARRTRAPVAPPELLEAVAPAAVRGEEDEATHDHHVLEEADLLHLARRAWCVFPETVRDQRGEHGEDEEQDRGKPHLHPKEQSHAAQKFDSRAKRREDRGKGHAPAVDAVDDRLAVHSF